MKNDRYEVKEEELPSDEYDNGVNLWYVYDNETDTVVNNEWFDTEKRATDYMGVIA
jgi:IS1 family transposase